MSEHASAEDKIQAPKPTTNSIVGISFGLVNPATSYRTNALMCTLFLPHMYYSMLEAPFNATSRFHT